MNIHTDFVNIYVMFCTTLKNQYDDVEFLDYGSIGKELYFKFKLKENVNKDLLLKKIIKNSHSVAQQIYIENPKIKIIDYIKLLKKNNQNYFANYYGNVLKFGEHFPLNDEHINLVKDLFRHESYEYKNYFYISRLLESIQFSAWNIEKNLKMNIEEFQKNHSSFLQMFLTYYFINLDALLKNLISNDVFKIEMKKIIEQIRIKEYKRYSFNKPINVNSINKLISHFRDAVCHLEEKNKIAHRLGGGQTSIISGRSLIRYGEGQVDWKTHLLKLVSQISNLIIGEKTYILVMEKQSKKYLFSVLYSELWNFPLLKQIYRIEKEVKDLKYTVFLKKIA